MKALSTGVLAEIAGQHRPVLLLTLYMDAIDGGTQYYARHGTDIVFRGITYEALGFGVNSVKMGSDMSVTKITVTLNNLDPDPEFLAQLLANRYEFRDRVLVLEKVYLDALTDPSNFNTVFSGRMTQPEISSDTFSLTASSAIVGIHQRGPKGTISVPCPWRFGGTLCGVDRTTVDNHKTGTAEAGSDTVQIVDTANRTEVDDYWLLGVVTMTSGANNGRSREVFDSINSSGIVKLDVEFDFAIQVGDTYTITRGCDKTATTCGDDYDNLDNYGGFPNLPVEILKAF